MNFFTLTSGSLVKYCACCEPSSCQQLKGFYPVKGFTRFLYYSYKLDFKFLSYFL